MFDLLIFDLADKVHRERLEETKSRRMVKRVAMSHPSERGKYIKAFCRQLLKQLEKAENRARRREATADRGLP
jgi:hypothetical protein